MKSVEWDGYMKYWAPSKRFIQVRLVLATLHCLWLTESCRHAKLHSPSWCQKSRLLRLQHSASALQLKLWRQVLAVVVRRPSLPITNTHTSH